MNCCKNKDNKHVNNQDAIQINNKKHGHMKMMAICCGTPILLLLLLPLLGYKGVLLNIIPFICPIMMFVMMPMMMWRRKNNTSNDNCHEDRDTRENKSLL